MNESIYKTINFGGHHGCVSVDSQRSGSDK